MRFVPIKPKKPCPCNNCKDRYFDEVAKRTCHCDCQRYKDWCEENKAISEEIQELKAAERRLREYELKRNNQIKKRCGL